MIRKQIVLGADQSESLKRLGRRPGRSEASIIREAIDTTGRGLCRRRGMGRATRRMASAWCRRDAILDPRGPI